MENVNSIDHLNTWYDKFRDTEKFTPVLVAINKIDLQEKAVSTIDKITKEIEKKFENIFLVSAQTGDGIQELFLRAATEAMQFSKLKAKECIIISKKDEKKIMLFLSILILIFSFFVLHLDV